MNYDVLADKDSILKAAAALEERGFHAIVVDTKEEALAKLKSIIPAGASVMNGSSRTLEEIGFIEYLKSGIHEWNNLHEEVLLEKDPAKQALLRKQSVLSDYYLGSVHALSRTGEMVIASNSGSQLPHLAFTSPNVILVVSTKKIMSTLSDALSRLEDHVVALEDARMKSIGYGGTMKSKTLILHHENKMMQRTVNVILVEENLGF